MPATNGYDLLLEAASSLTGLAILEVEDEPSDADLAQFLSVNRGALDRARAALKQPCEVPLEYTRDFFPKYIDAFPVLRTLARSFEMELKAAERRDDLSDAATIGLTILDLANAVRRGGLISGMLMALGAEHIGMRHLRVLRQRLSPASAARLANALLRMEEEREPFDPIAARDRKWEELFPPPKEPDFTYLDELDVDEETKEWFRELRQTLDNLPDDQQHGVYLMLDTCNLALLRLLAVESALLCFHARIGSYPSDLSHLAPDCIATVPFDPFTGTGFKYRPTPAGFVLYSLGPLGHDHGGTFGSLLHVLSGEADLGIDMYDYRDDDI
jgi:hypothetical protein